MRILLIIFLFLSLSAHGQYIPFAIGRPTDTAKTNGSILVPGVVRIPFYANSDTDKILTTGADGKLKFKSLSATTGATTQALADSVSGRVKYSDSDVIYITPYDLRNYTTVSDVAGIVGDTAEIVRGQMEFVANKVTTFNVINNILYPSTAAVNALVNTTVAGYVPITRTLTINGVTYDLSADRAWTLLSGVYNYWGVKIHSGDSIEIDTSLLATKLLVKKQVDSAINVIFSDTSLHVHVLGWGLTKQGDSTIAADSFKVASHHYVDSSRTWDFAKADSNTNGNAITLTYFNTHTPLVPVTSVFGRTGDVIALPGDYAFSDLSGTPTTVSGYGITDAVTTSDVIQIDHGGTGAHDQQTAADNILNAPGHDGMVYGNIAGVGTWITPNAGTVTSITATAPLTGGIITASGSIGLGTTGTAGTYGSGTQVPVITTDVYGRVSGVTTTTITPAYSNITGTPDLSGYALKTTSLSINGTTQDISTNRTWSVGTVTGLTLPAVNGFSGTFTSGATPVLSVSVTPTAGSILKSTSTGGVTAATPGTDYLTTNQTITLTGDVTGSGTTGIATTLNTGNAYTWGAVQTYTVTPLMKAGVKYAGATSGTVTVTVPAVITSYTWAFPSNAGTTGYVLQTDGSGNTSWQPQSGGGGGTIVAVNGSDLITASTTSGTVTVTPAVATSYTVTTAHTMTVTATSGHSVVIVMDNTNTADTIVITGMGNTAPGWGGENNKGVIKIFPAASGTSAIPYILPRGNQISISGAIGNQPFFDITTGTGNVGAILYCYYDNDIGGGIINWVAQVRKLN